MAIFAMFNEQKHNSTYQSEVHFTNPLGLSRRPLYDTNPKNATYLRCAYRSLGGSSKSVKHSSVHGSLLFAPASFSSKEIPFKFDQQRFAIKFDSYIKCTNTTRSLQTLTFSKRVGSTTNYIDGKNIWLKPEMYKTPSNLKVMRSPARFLHGIIELLLKGFKSMGVA